MHSDFWVSSIAFKCCSQHVQPSVILVSLRCYFLLIIWISFYCIHFNDPYFNRPYFNDLSTWSKAHGSKCTQGVSESTFASIMTGKTVGAYSIIHLHYLCSLHNNIILHCNPLLFYVWRVFLCCCTSLCVLSKVSMRCGPTQWRIFY